VLPTAFVAEWHDRPDEAKREAQRLRDEIMRAVREGRTHLLLPFSGQTAGMVRDILPAAEVVNRIVADAESALKSGAALTG
jgi:nitronate monooxygenase/enoyl-[acyl-carrier protein] reductase II